MSAAHAADPTLYRERDIIPVRRALLSVTDKSGIVELATALNEAAKVIRDGHDGLLVQPGDASKFAEATLKLVNDPKERSRLGKNAREQAVKQYSWEHYTRRLEEIYLNVMGNAPSGSPLVDSSGNH